MNNLYIESGYSPCELKIDIWPNNNDARNEGSKLEIEITHAKGRILRKGRELRIRGVCR